jgi:hypothetical protein
VAESVHEQVLAALQAHLAGIVGDGGATYWYTPDRVLRPAAFHGACLDPSLTTIYSLSPVRVEDKPVNISIGMEAVLTVDLAVATRFTPDAGENPLQQTEPFRWTIQSRLERDAKKRLRSNYNLLGVSGAHRFTAVPVTDYAPDLTYLEGWALVFLRVQLRYTYPDTTP